MKKNVGMTDKIIRGTVAAIIALLVFSQYNYWYTTALF
jgi:hypothetical protein